MASGAAESQRAFCLVAVALLASLSTTAGAQRLICQRFDCGTITSPVKMGWIQVTPETIYTLERGYGWLRPPSTAFDRSEIFVPDWLKPFHPQTVCP